MRKLTNSEISELVKQGCSSQDWMKIDVADDFTPCAFTAVTFVDSVYLPYLDIDKKQGVSYSLLQNCILDEGVYIHNVSEGIYNYHIGKDVFISNCRKIYYEPFTQCGEGVKINPLDEMGSRSIYLFDTLTAQLAYLLVFARHSQTLSKNLLRLTTAYIEKQKPKERSFIASNSQIKNCGDLINIHIKKSSFLSDVPYLKNVTLSSSTLRTGAIVQNSVCIEGALVEEYSTLSHCFVGEASHISGALSAQDSLIFSNCHLANGEVVASILGPHTVSHHRSTLLVGACLSFFNAGSGTNQSNHHYRLGPMHYGVMEKGCKTASNAYILWPAHIGAFSKVSGRITNRADFVDFPFSSISQVGQAIYLEPGTELSSIGFYRDLDKWKKRDKRNLQKKFYDLIDYRFFTPSLLYCMMNGLQRLEQMKVKNPDAERYLLCSSYLSNSALNRGIRTYRTALLYFIVDTLLQREGYTYHKTSDSSTYFDFLGISIEEGKLHHFFDDIEAKKVKSLEEVHQFFIESYVSKEEDVLLNRAISLLLPEGEREEYGIKILLEEATIELPKMLLDAYKDAEREVNPKRLCEFGLLSSRQEDKKEEAKNLRSSLLQQDFLLHFREEIESISEKITKIKNSLL